MRKIMKIPKYAQDVTKALNEAGFEAFLVGGCVRDLLMKREPKDWDIATNAKPEEIVKTFPDGKYENGFGTVMLPIKYLLEDTSEKTADLGVIEITTYRIESKYTDRRHPDEVKFAKTLEEDLGRRDFTINALALEISQNKKVDDEHRLIDLFEGQKDLENKVIRAVGEPSERFAEDALRMMRAVRFSVQLDFSIEEKTFLAIQKNANNLKYISKERIQDELQKIILSQKPARGMELLHKTGLLNHIIPEIEEGFNVTQSHHHYHGPYKTVFKHLVASLEKCPSQKLEVRLASLLHDIGKPLTKKGEGEDATFHNHEYAGAKIAKRILERLKFPRAVIDKTVLLVRNHMFYYNVDEVGEAGVRRVIRKVGLENINDLIDVRIADRLGSGVPKAVPYKLRHFKFMVEKVSQDPISVKQLKINGNDLMEKLKISPGPKIGTILDVLLAKVIEEPKLNEKETLLEIAKDLDKKNLNDLRKMAKAKIEEEKEEEERLMKKKYWVE
jgi:tRNA nucleotidyltransferase (CCA-adding enzyme)